MRFKQVKVISTNHHQRARKAVTLHGLCRVEGTAGMSATGVRRTVFSLARLRWTALTVVSAATAAILVGTGVVRVPCLFRTALGIDCPMCGGTRMLGALMHGDVLAAADLNAFAVFVFLPLTVMVLIAGARMEMGRASRMWPRGRLGVVCSIGFGSALVAWTIVRNLPFAPFDVLRA
jgi:hypothetical protein